MPEFGSDLRKYRFDPLDRVLMERVRYTITEDIRRWEPRISLTSIEFLTDAKAIDNSILYVSISYRIINTDVIGNYVYPYKLSTYDTLDISYN
jgi:phage baseplate assembly protein W